MKTNIFRYLGLATLLAAFSFTFFQCGFNAKSTVSSPKYTIQEPFEKVKVNSQSYKIDAEKGGEIKLENGTRITVPANAFVDKSGKPVTGEVELKYREFHTAADIIASGIPMKMTDGGKEYDFESAGMFEIKGFSGTNEIDIARDKALDVQLASYKEEDNYNHYYFDETKGEWAELAKAVKPEPNPAKAVSEATAAAPSATKEVIEEEQVVEKPMQPIKYNPNATVLNLDVNYAKYPYLKEFNGILWQYAGDAENDPKNNAWLAENQWRNLDLQLQPGTASVFKLTADVGKRKYEALVVPALKGKSFDKAMARYQKSLQDFNTRQAQLAATNNFPTNYQRQGDVMRAFQVNNFGIYNCDRYRNTSNLTLVNSTFDFAEVPDNGVLIYHVNKRDNSVVTYSSGTPSFYYNPSGDNMLVAVLPNDRVAVVDNEDFREAKGKKDYTFRFQTLSRDFATLEDLDDLVKGL